MKKYNLILLSLLLLTSCTTINQDSNEGSESISEKQEIISDITLDSNYLNNEYIKVCGKTYFDNGVVLNFSSSYIEVNFKGSNLEGYFEAYTQYDVKVYVDDNDPFLLTIPNTSSKLTVVSSLENKDHTVKIYKINESQYGKNFKVSRLLTDGNFNKVNKDKLKIEFFGDSITCGYGINATHEDNPKFVNEEEDSTKTYAHKLSELFDADYQVTSGSGWCLYVDDANYNEIEKDEIPSYFEYCDLTYNHRWDTNNFIPDIVVINLGTNDAYSGYYLESSVEAKNKYLTGYKNKYKQFINKIYDTYGKDTFIVCLYGTMSVVDVFDKAISSIVTSVNEDTCMYLCSKCLDKTKVSNQFMPCGHPNEDMHKYISEELYTLLFAWFEEE